MNPFAVSDWMNKNKKPETKKPETKEPNYPQQFLYNEHTDYEI